MRTMMHPVVRRQITDRLNPLLRHDFHQGHLDARHYSNPNAAEMGIVARS
jgi:hypothetical protein